MFAEILVLIFIVIVTKFLWFDLRDFWLISKIPSVNLKINMKTIYEVIKADSKIIFDFMMKLSAEESIAKLTFGFYTVVVVQEPDDVKTILNSKNCLGKTFIEKFFHLEEGSLFGKIDAWQRHHKALVPFFTSLHMKNYLSIFNEKSLKLVENLKMMNGKEFNIFYPIAAITLGIILKAMELNENIMELDEADRDEPMKNLEW